MKPYKPVDQRWHWLQRTMILLLGIVLVAFPALALTTGSRGLYPDGEANFRANLEWRTSTYGDDLLLRRTLLKVYAEAGEAILLASSAVGVDGTPNNGDIRVYDPGLVTGAVGQELIPDTPSFSCMAQRAEPGNADRGRIGSRVEELAGPNPGGGYDSCVYTAPEDGVYNVVFLGPAGDASDEQSRLVPSGRVEAIPQDFSSEQTTSITAWDVTVRENADSTESISGRLFSYYLTIFTGANRRPFSTTAFIVTSDGFIYEVDVQEADGNGFVLFSNQLGFLDTNDAPLYRDVLADPSLEVQQQNQLDQLQGGVRLQPPTHLLFFEFPDAMALRALEVPEEAILPRVENFAFDGSQGGNVTSVGQGGTFSLDNNSTGVANLVISRDGVNFDPTNPQNRVLYRFLNNADTSTVEWDGLDNVGDPFLAGQSYEARVFFQGGEVHFPALDLENNLGGTQITLQNPPNDECPPWIGGCSGAFYDDRGYLTANGDLVGVAINEALCADNVGTPPVPLFSDPVLGYDSSTRQRRWGSATGGNPDMVCDPAGGFGDKKGIDFWTYYPSNSLTTLVIVAEPASVTLEQFAATHTADGIAVTWETSAEIDSWGFHLWRSADESRAGAVRLTDEPILAEGRGQGGATYRWLDRQVQPGISYTYWLEEIETSGTTHEYGPVTVSETTTSGAFRLILPVLQR